MRQFDKSNEAARNLRQNGLRKRFGRTWIGGDKIMT